MTAAFLLQLGQFQSEFEDVLDQVLPKPEGTQSQLFNALRYAALGGGKRLRPFLLLETVKLFRELKPEDWIVAAALECVHVYSLIHDDLPCMDDDDMRRGKPTVHKAFDEAMAVLAGDALLTLAFKLISDSGLNSDLAIQLISDLSRAAGGDGMIGGQVIDISVESEARSEEIITQLQRLKTGALIEFAVTTGAKLTGASADQIKGLAEFAADLGLAFQIKDDILDIEGSAEAVGKAVGKDENLGKVTFVSILGLNGAKEKARTLADRAKSRLAPYGKQANMLCDTVDFVLDRAN